jgi:hypothetical protein
MAAEAWQVDFLASLALTPNVAQACREARVTRAGAYKAREADPEFAAAWDAALEESTDDLVGEAYRRAREGTVKPVYYKGEKCGGIREYSDTLAIFLLKAHRRSVYGDKVQTDLTSQGNPVSTVLYFPDNGRQNADVPPGPAPPAGPARDVP